MSDLISNGIPEGIAVESLDLSPKEAKAYPRWYTDLLLRKGKQAVAVGDVLSFVENFGLKDSDKRCILNVFGNNLVTLDPAQFYIFLRLAGHILDGKQDLAPELVFVQAQVPRPRSILSRKRKSRPNSNIETESAKNNPVTQGPGNPFRKQAPTSSSSAGKMDIDSFATFLLTGNRPSANTSSDDESFSASPTLNGEAHKKKRVTFNNEPEVAEAAARSMEELIRQRQIQDQMYAQLPTPQYDPPPLPEKLQNDDDEEDDVEFTNNAFANVKVDSVLHNGISVAAPDSESQSVRSLAEFAKTFEHPRDHSPSPPITDTLQFASKFIPPSQPSMSDSSLSRPQITSHPSSAANTYLSSLRNEARMSSASENLSYKSMNRSTKGLPSAPAPSIFYPGGEYPPINSSSEPSLAATFPALPAQRTGSPASFTDNAAHAYVPSQRQTSGGSFLPPPPPNPRGNATIGKYSSSSSQQMQPLPNTPLSRPPPPPPRKRAPSLNSEAGNTHGHVVPPPVPVQRHASASSAPDLVGEIDHLKLR